MRRSESFVVECKALLGHDADIKLDKAKTFGGRYRLYRPFHLDPKSRVTIGVLTLGGLDSPFECSLHEVFNDGDEVKEMFAEGRMVPHGSRLLALLTTTDDSRSSFILHFSQVEREGRRPGSKDKKPPVVSNFGGIMLAAVGNDPSSAWPCFGQRIPDGEAAQPDVQDYEHLASKRPVLRSLARGAIYWRESDYPDPFNPR